MKVKKNIIFSLGFVLLFANVINSQSSILNIDRLQNNNKKKTQVKQKKLDFGYIDERDVLWSKVVWEYVDLKSAKNGALLATMNGNNAFSGKKSLFEILVSEVSSYRGVEAYTDSYFTEKMNRDDVKNKLTDVRKKGEYVDYFEIKSEDIYGFLMKGIWYFDKREAKSKFRLLGIAPMGPDVKSLGVKGIDENNVYELFWVYYPSLRKNITELVVYDKSNQATAIPLDYYLISRQYNAVEIEENSIGNSKLGELSTTANLFQLKQTQTRTDSLLVKKEKTIWAKKRVVVEEPKRKRFSLRDIFKSKKLSKDDSIKRVKKDVEKAKRDSLILKRKYQ